MKIAYLLLVHNNPDHLKRLINALETGNSFFFIHVDKKSRISEFWKDLCRENVIFIDKRESVYWGEFSVCQAILNCIVSVLNFHEEFNYLCLLSGSDYPLRSGKYIESYLINNEGIEFINIREMPCEEIGKPIERLQRYIIQKDQNEIFPGYCIDAVNKILRDIVIYRRDHRKYLNGLKPYCGSMWWALTMNASKYIISFTDSNRDIVNFFRNVVIPDESFFHTIIGNSEYFENISANLTYADWSEGGPHPSILNKADIYKIMN